ncbi:hypothetical protein ACFUTX_08995 [Microbacterium sp. NPDC057407]|uniref:hypothetical protein n=1 Tax=Microbacterium sp. NPDC057407 TaxID=3346120 RepID=UPI00366E1E60
MKVDVKTLDGSPMSATAAVQPLGSGLRIAPGFAASTTDKSTGLATRIEAKYVRSTGRYVVKAVTVESTVDAVEVNANTLRQVTVQAIMQAAAPHCIALTLDDSTHATWLSVYELSTRDGRLIPEWLATDVVKRGSSEARLDVVEILYGVAALSGQAPLRMIMNELGIPHRTASDWTRKARAAGRLEGMTAAAGRKADG